MKIVLLEPLFVPDPALERLSDSFRADGHKFVSYATREEDDEIILSRAADADIVMIGNLPLSGQVICGLRKLKMISVAFTGVDHVALDACRARGITVCNCAGYSTDSVAELSFGLMIAVLRNLVQCDRATREGKTRAGLIGHDLSGKTLGIIGTGAIGLRVAQIGKAFGCRLLACSRSQRIEAVNLGVRYVFFDELLEASDIVTLHVPLTDETGGMISREKIALMKSSAILINTSRGPVVDNIALADALEKGEIAGAGIDVFDIEPPLNPQDPLLKQKKAVFAPHVAFATWEAFDRRATLAVNNVTQWLNGTPVNVID